MKVVNVISQDEEGRLIMAISKVLDEIKRKEEEQKLKKQKNYLIKNKLYRYEAEC
jgi:hypothetical protein